MNYLLGLILTRLTIRRPSIRITRAPFIAPQHHRPKPGVSMMKLSRKVAFLSSEHEAIEERFRKVEARCLYLESHIHLSQESIDFKTLEEADDIPKTVELCQDAAKRNSLVSVDFPCIVHFLVIFQTSVVFINICGML
jgi:hypothetical protein